MVPLILATLLVVVILQIVSLAQFRQNRKLIRSRVQMLQMSVTAESKRLEKLTRKLTRQSLESSGDQHSRIPGLVEGVAEIRTRLYRATSLIEASRTKRSGSTSEIQTNREIVALAMSSLANRFYVEFGMYPQSYQHDLARFFGESFRVKRGKSSEISDDETLIQREELFTKLSKPAFIRISVTSEYGDEELDFVREIQSTRPWGHVFRFDYDPSSHPTKIQSFKEKALLFASTEWPGSVETDLPDHLIFLPRGPKG